MARYSFCTERVSQIFSQFTRGDGIFDDDDQFGSFAV